MSTFISLAGTFVLVVLIVFVITMTVLYIVDYFSKNRWFCDKMGWHKSPNSVNHIGHDNLEGGCSRCGKSVMLDSQGNWF